MIETLLLAVLAAFLLMQLVTTGLFLRRIYRPDRRAGSIGQPRIALLRPVCGVDAFDAETLQSSFDQDYPDYEIIFCAPRADDPAVALVRRLIAANPGVSARLLIGLAPVSGNPKLNNLWKGWRAADADWICMSDSNLLLPQDYLRRIVAAWGPKTGLVSAPPIGTRPKGFAGSLECAFLNSNQARLQFASDSFGQGFAQGKTLFWNRAMLDKAGGIAALGRHLAEDVTATKITRAAGLRVSLTHLPCAQPIGQRSARQVWDRQLRWSRVRRDGFPALFALEFANGAAFAMLICAVAVAWGAITPLMAVAYLGLWYTAEIVLMRVAGWPARWQDVLALPVRDLLIPVIWGVTFLRRGIEWRGTVMDVPAPAGDTHSGPDAAIPSRAGS